MQSVIRSRVFAVWSALLVATVASWQIGSNHGLDGAKTAGLAVLLIGFVKLRLVGIYFMEIRDAPSALRGIFETWCAVACTAICVAYLLV